MLNKVSKTIKNTFAISGSPIRSVHGFDDFSTSWLTKKQIGALNLTLKSDAKALPCFLRAGEPSFDCYQIGDIIEEKELARVLQKPQISIATGNAYRQPMLFTLIRASMDKKYSSNLWGTKECVEKHGCALKSGEEPLKIDIGDNDISLYNMDQCADKEAIQTVFEQRQKIPKSCRTGGEFVGEARKVLEEAAEKFPNFSSFWLTRKQAESMGVLISGDIKGVRAMVDGQELEFINASQTKNEKEVIKVAQQNRSNRMRNKQ